MMFMLWVMTNMTHFKFKDKIKQHIKNIVNITGIPIMIYLYWITTINNGETYIPKSNSDLKSSKPNKQ